ncbi:hypothetical protein CMV_016249 [Castanea mollissima]|uniref:Uncharacterized protein n=1 Tax=Castanea mollissima TaxID=60419 RepID=A0A8J4QT15_9ROSI|nr:hypothetical protein CMV_016249 [Castanea mollissima]
MHLLKLMRCPAIMPITASTVRLLEKVFVRTANTYWGTQRYRGLHDIVVTPRSTSANRRWSCSVDLLTRSFSVISWSTMLEENETPGWTQLKLPGQAPSSRCGHTVTSGGHYLLLFGGHGTSGWLSRYDIYYNDCIVLDQGECLTTLLVGFLADMCWMCHHDVNERSILFML